MYDSKLKTLLTVYKTGNYTSAAKQLNLTQPAVSQQISQLENEYNIKIFNRYGNKITPTSYGTILINYAKRIIYTYKELDLKIKDEMKQMKSLSIGITHSLEGNIVPEVLATFASKNAGMKIKIVSDSIKNLYDKLSTYEIDLAVIEGKINGEKLSKVLLDTDSLVAVISNDNPLSKKSMVDINDLKKEKLILRSSKSATRNLFTSQLEVSNLSLDEFNVILEIDNTFSIKELVSKNIGVSILPKSICYHEFKDKRLTILPIKDMNMITEINLAFIKNTIDESVINEIVNTYKEATSK